MCLTKCQHHLCFVRFEKRIRQTIAIDDPVAWASVSLSRKRLFLLIYQMAPLRYGCYYATVATCLQYYCRSTIVLYSIAQ